MLHSVTNMLASDARNVILCSSTNNSNNNQFNSHRTIQAMAAIEPNVCSKPFYFDILRLMSILYNGNANGSNTNARNNNHVNRKSSKQLQIKDLDGTLHCDSDPCSWMYRVRLAANCFEQNLCALPASSVAVETNENYHHRLDSLTNNGGAPRQIRIVLCTIRLIEPNEELCFWPSFGLHLLLEIPFLRPSNIVSGNCFVCTQCGKCYTQPNPLKIHLKFACPVSLNNNNNNSSTMLPLYSHHHHNPHHQLNENGNSTLLTLSPSLETHAKVTISHATNSATDKLYCDSLASLSHHTKGRHSKRHSTLVKEAQQHSEVTTRKLHNCSYCGKVYTRKYGLKIHIRTHTGLKPLSCRFCGRSFSDPSNLNKHVRLHSQQANGTTVVVDRVS